MQGIQEEDDNNTISEINIIPLVDVMLVLLILFIITAPLLVPYAIEVELPEVQSQPITEAIEDPIMIIINAKGDILWQDQIISLDDLAQRFAIISNNQTKTPLHFQADKTVAYEKVAQILGLAQENNITQLGFITQPLDTLVTKDKNPVTP